MKRKTLAFLLCLMLLAALALNASAASNLPMVVDDAALFSEEEQIALEEKALALRSQYETDIVILTIDSLGGQSAQNYADDYFDYNGYGYGDNYSGILFLLSMKEREWYISTCGDTIYAVTDYDIQQLGETAAQYLSAGSYYEAFDAYLDALPRFLDAYQKGNPMDGHADYSRDYDHGERENAVYYEREHSPNILLSLIAGIVAATVTVVIMVFSMNTKRQQHSASGYLRPGSFRVRTHQDMFLYSNVSKVRRQQNNGGSKHGGSKRGGRSSVHRSSSGRRHGGGGGKF